MMRTIVFWTLLVCFPFIAVSSGGAVEIALFNGKNLEGWSFDAEDDNNVNLEDVWFVQNGVLVCRGFPYGVLRRQEPLENYALTLDWRWPPSTAGTTALFVHALAEKDQFGNLKSIEVSLFRDNAGDVYYRGLPIDSDFLRERKIEGTAEKEMGEWNKLQVICRGKTVTVFVNGRPVNRVTDIPYSKGTVGLQCRGTPVFFRNIKLQTTLQKEHLHEGGTGREGLQEGVELHRSPRKVHGHH